MDVMTTPATTHLDRAHIESLDRIARLNLINSITGYKPANLIGTISADGHENLAIFSSVVHLGSNPALIGMVTRPVTVERDTYENIRETGCWTINAVHRGLEEKAHATSAGFGREVSEFEICGMKSEFLDEFQAPYLVESRLKMGLKLEEEQALSNGTILLIGRVEHLYLPEEYREGGRVDLEALDIMSISGLDRYHTPLDGKEFPYAKVEDYKDKWAARPDHIVFDEEEGRYNASILPYATDFSAPVITVSDMTHWKQTGAQRISHHLESRFDEIKEQYLAMKDLYEWNQAVYNADFNFEPVMGETYHLYARPGKRPFLSLIPPKDFKQKHLGSFRLNSERIWELIED